jgi:tRNA-dihydrouridine synthase A
MMAWTDRHCRYFFRQLSRHALLYTEMLTANALVHGDSDRLLAFDPLEHPVAAQIGGSDPRILAKAARLVEAAGYDEVNINVGCPSDRVQSGDFGAALMAKPARVATCVQSMRDACTIPVTVKTRIGIDHLDSYEFLLDFIATVADAGCDTFIIHARKAWLHGLSPKQNREIPPLDYGVAKRLKAQFPSLSIILNGGLDSLEAAQSALANFEGTMLGRAVYHNPYLLSGVDKALFNDPQAAPTRRDAVIAMLPYMDRHLAGGGRLAQVAKHLLGLYLGEPGARRWRRTLSTEMHAAGSTTDVVRRALDALPASAAPV